MENKTTWWETIIVVSTTVLVAVGSAIIAVANSDIVDELGD